MLTLQELRLHMNPLQKLHIVAYKHDYLTISTRCTNENIPVELLSCTVGFICSDRDYTKDWLYIEINL